MKEAARLQRNADRIGECFPAFGSRMRRVLDTLEAKNFRPRIQDGWRSPEDQLNAFNHGFSRLKFGFHNVTGPGDSRESLACDVLDDDSPLAPSSRYLLALALAARGEEIETGILWDLPGPLVAGVESALATRNIDAPVKVGFDPTHVQPCGLTPSSARKGVRPTFASVARGAIGDSVPADLASVHIVKPGDSLGKIARIHGVTLAHILELNPQFIPNPNLIHVGDKVRLR